MNKSLAVGEAVGAEAVEGIRSVGVAAMRADSEVVRRGLLFVAVRFEQVQVAQVVRGGPDQCAGRETLASREVATDLRLMERVRSRDFKADAAVDIPLGCTPKEDDALRWRVAPAQLTDRHGAILLLYPLGVGHRPKERGNRVAVLLVGDAGELLVLHRLNVFAAAASGQLLQSRPVTGGVWTQRGLRDGIVHPAEHRGRADQK